MRLKIPCVLMILTVLVTACGKKDEQQQQQNDPSVSVHVVPRPVLTTLHAGYVEWNGAITVGASTEDEKKVAALLVAFLKTKNIEASTAAGKGNVTLSTIKVDSLGAEGYTLAINEDGVALQANAGAGFFYGFQTLLQIVGEHGKKLPYTTITDYPRFGYRGLHLDVSRHMFSVEAIKKYIDLMALHKLNRFHWHLTDDQGWRIEIKKYPKLQEIAAYRKETVIGHARTADRKENKNYDGKRYGGFYTQEEVKDVVKYAADRFITVVPEIEMPGHARAALSAYPQLGCTGGPYTAATTWGVFEEVFCAGKEETFTFLQDVLDEVIPLFPSPYVHVGGDECPKESWKKCPQCQKRMKAEGLKDEHALQSYFIQRMEKYINSKGKQIIGWDEILEGGLAPNATVMSWRGEEGGIAAAQQNHDVIMTPTGWCYFDYYQDSAKTEPLAIGGFLPVKKVYLYEPQPPQLTAAEAAHIRGVQANVWTEYITTPEHLEYMVYPRASALSEIAWSPREARDYEDFLRRMDVHFKRLDDWHVNYAKHILKDIENLSTSAQ